MPEYQPNELLTVATVCAEYRLGRTLLYELLNKGELVALKIGKRATRFRRSDVENWISSRPLYKPAVGPAVLPQQAGEARTDQCLVQGRETHDQD